MGHISGRTSQWRWFAATKLTVLFECISSWSTAANYSWGSRLTAKGRSRTPSSKVGRCCLKKNQPCMSMFLGPVKIFFPLYLVFLCPIPSSSFTHQWNVIFLRQISVKSPRLLFIYFFPVWRLHLMICLISTWPVLKETKYY